MKSGIPNVVIASILAEPAWQRKFAGFFSYLSTVHRWNLRILRAQDEITAFFRNEAALLKTDGVIYSGRQDAEGITPGDVAAHLGISRPLLDLRFRETQKTSVGRLITETKLSEVARKLRETKLSIAAIQETCGFKNANALKNLFKRRYKMSMRDYRAQDSQR